MNFNVKSPATTDELFELVTEYQDKKFRFGAGCTDLLLELKKAPEEEMTIINLTFLADDLFTSISEVEGGIRIGALVSANKIASSKELQNHFPVLAEAASLLASRQIRQVATVGGNLCTASPAGDISTALVALEAQCEIVDTSGSVRTIPITEFFKGVRQTDMKSNELLRSIIVPSNIESNLHSKFIKIGTRRSMECSVISLAYHLQADGNDTIVKAGISIGSLAPTIKFVQSACDFLAGKSLSSISDAESIEFADKVLDYASPISDIRASAWYRKEVLHNISRGIFE